MKRAARPSRRSTGRGKGKCAPLREHSSLLEERQGVFRVQAVPLQAEPQMQHGDTREPAAAEVLVHHDAPADEHEEKLFRRRAPAAARAQELQSGWAMLHKIHNAMGKRDSEYGICGAVELDEGFFSTETEDGEKDRPLKRGRGSQRKSKVLVMAQTGKGNATRKSDKPTSVKYIKMFVIRDLKAETIDEKVRMYINQSTIKSDDSKSYTNFGKIVKEHIHQAIEPRQAGKVLP